MNIQRAIDWNVAFWNKKWDIDYDLEFAMLKEELEEFYNSIINSDRVESVDAIFDIIFVAIGTAHKMWMSIDDINYAWNEVCDSNFTKLPIDKDDNGKIKKSENFFAPDLSRFW